MPYTHEELDAYINKFPEYQRDNVYKAILDAELLADALRLPEGKLIMNNAIDQIAKNVMTITRTCVEKEFDPQKIIPLAFEINILYEMLKEWAIILKKPEART